VAFLGASTPVDSVQRWVTEHAPDAVVMSAVQAACFQAVAGELRELSRRAPLLLGGAGASPELARSVGARALDEDPLLAAERLSSDVPGG
jgi:MerR family transcriptional regulator, light-induced transcriptional regulator